MELLARGRFTDNATLISIKYAKGLYQMIASLKCLGVEEKHRGDVNMDKLKKRLEDESLHLEYFNQCLKKECEYILDDEMLVDGEEKIKQILDGGMESTQ